MHAETDHDAIAAVLSKLSADYAPTPLETLSEVAAGLGVAQLYAKNEGRRALGSFKSLGGTYAGLRALARAIGTDTAGLLRGSAKRRNLPTLICASDGNHGLAVAAAAEFAGGTARIFLHGGVPPKRARRIERRGADIVWIEGTYDDAVAAALAAAKAGDGILVADTTKEPDDPVVADVVRGYGVIAAEIRRQFEAAGHAKPTHLFVQAGVGGLAAAMASGLEGWLDGPARLVVVEPENAGCVAAALRAGRVVRVPGDLETVAEMLSCGEASAPALETLLRHGARAVTVPEAELTAAARMLAEKQGPRTTPSGAAGLAGLTVALKTPALAAELDLDASSRVLIVVTEAELEGASEGPRPACTTF